MATSLSPPLEAEGEEDGQAAAKNAPPPTRSTSKNMLQAAGHSAGPVPLSLN
jgi:hypothetical protein